MDMDLMDSWISWIMRHMEQARRCEHKAALQEPGEAAPIKQSTRSMLSNCRAIRQARQRSRQCSLGLLQA